MPVIYLILLVRNTYNFVLNYSIPFNLYLNDLINGWMDEVPRAFAIYGSETC